MLNIAIKGVPWIKINSKIDIYKSSDAVCVLGIYRDLREGRRASTAVGSAPRSIAIFLSRAAASFS